MRVMFIQGGSRWKFDDKGNVYTDANFNDEIWDRYRKYGNELVVVLRRETTVYSQYDAMQKFNLFNKELSGFISLPDIYNPLTNYFNPQIHQEIEKTIRREVELADRIIIRSIGTIYTNIALKWARRLNKKYLVEETGFSFEALWYHSFHGKFVALQNEYSTRRLMKDVPLAIYVTNEALQKRYPCKGKSIGCSDVQVITNDEDYLDRIKRINSKKSKIVFGTAAFLDVGWKGQKYVIEAISELKKKGITEIEYQMIGSGTGNDLKRIITKLGVDDQVKIIGALPHSEVYDWLKTIDVYIQPSFMEGLCRSIVEAMSKACPVICSDVGGNYELVDKNCMFTKGKVDEILTKIEMMLDTNVQRDKAKKNFDKAKEYNKNILDAKREQFYKEFLKGEEN